MLSDEDRKARHCAYCKKYRDNNRERVQAQQAAYRERHKERVLERNRAWVDNNYERNKEQKYKHYLKNKERYDAKARIYAKSRPAWKAAHCAKRRSQKKKAMPLWVNEGYIALFYEGAKIEAKRTGRNVEVDHIVPLHHKLVCGLHCEDNLQLLFSEDNQAKSNKFYV